MRLWQAAQAGFVRCSSSRSRTVFGAAASWFSGNSGTPGGAGGGGLPSSASRTHLPRRTGLVRCGWDETARTAAMVRMPPRWLSSGSLNFFNCCLVPGTRRP